jgi:hypothetical protein
MRRGWNGGQLRGFETVLGFGNFGGIFGEGEHT